MEDGTKVAQIITAVGVSYRYKKPDGKSSTSKISLSLDIFSYLSELFEDDKAAFSWVASKASSIREVHDKKISSYVREESLMMIIDSKWIDGYEVNPNYEHLLCRWYNDDDFGSYSPVNLPMAMVYAMEKMGVDYKSECTRIQQELRDTKSYSSNYSDTIRSELLERMVYDYLIK